MNNIIFISGGARSGKSRFAEKMAEKINNRYSHSRNIAYIATSEVMDDEFYERIKKHKERRGNIFSTYEECIKISDVFEKIYGNHNVFLLECLTTWLGNLFFDKEGIIEKYDISLEEFIDVSIQNISERFRINKRNSNKENSIFDHKEEFFEQAIFQGKSSFERSLSGILKDIEGDDKWLIIVSNEVGLGIVPEDKVTRKYRDLLGIINQGIAKIADMVFFTVSGIPIRIK